jgi:PPOX class probable F420-dependent enzyme
MATTTRAVIPEALLDLLTSDVLAHITTVGRDGMPLTHVMWLDWDGSHVLFSSPVGSVKGRNLRERPQVSISVVDRRDPWRWLGIQARVTDIHPDEGLAFINHLSERYMGRPYPRTGKREIFVATPERVRASFGRGG